LVFAGRKTGEKVETLLRVTREKRLPLGGLSQRAREESNL